MASAPVTLAVRALAANVRVAAGDGAEAEIGVVAVRNLELLAHQVAAVPAPARRNLDLQELAVAELSHEPTVAVIRPVGQQAEGEHAGNAVEQRHSQNVGPRARR